MKKSNRAKAETNNNQIKNEKQEGQKWQSVKKQGNGYVITINAKPNSKQTKVTQINQQFVGISIAAPPRQGQANEQLVGYMSKLLNAKKSAVYVDKGGKSRNKMVVIQQCKLSHQEILQLLKKEI